MKGVIKLMVTPFIFLKSLIYDKILINLKKERKIMKRQILQNVISFEKPKNSFSRCNIRLWQQ